jgi:predicted aspartyl protease
MRLLPLLGLLSVIGCVNDDEPAFTTSGLFGAPIPLESAADLLLVEVSIDGTPSRPFLVDTGAQFVLLDEQYAQELGYSGQSTIDDLSMGELSFHGVAATSWDLDAFSAGVGVPLAGILGASLFQHVTFLVDTRRREARFLDNHEEALGLLDDAHVEQEAGTARVTNRLGLAFVDALIEDSSSAQMLLDTGASTTFLFRNTFDELSSNGRPVVDGLEGLGMAGIFDLTFSRLCGLALGSALAQDIHVGVVPDEAFGDAAALLPAMRGLIGSTFFREFLTVFDMPRGEARFYRYRAPAPQASTEFVQIGLFVDRDASGTVLVEVIVPGTDAATRDIAVGDVLLSIDGVPTAGLEMTELNASLEGEPGEARLLEFEDSPGPRFVEVLVEDLLPPCL